IGSTAFPSRKPANTSRKCSPTSRSTAPGSERRRRCGSTPTCVLCRVRDRCRSSRRSYRDAPGLGGFLDPPSSSLGRCERLFAQGRLVHRVDGLDDLQAFWLDVARGPQETRPDLVLSAPDDLAVRFEAVEFDDELEVIRNARRGLNA